MGVPTHKQRFVRSKCDRCGKSTPAKIMGEWDLFTLPHEWGAPCADQGNFCQPCIGKYSPENWQQWLIKRDKLED